MAVMIGGPEPIDCCEGAVCRLLSSPSSRTKDMQRVYEQVCGHSCLTEVVDKLLSEVGKWEASMARGA